MLLGSSAAEVSASPWIHAHRGGPLENGKAALSENSMPAFREAAARGFVIEADVKLSTDNVPMVIHDDELNRTTNCTGPVSALTAAQLGDCEIAM